MFKKEDSICLLFALLFNVKLNWFTVYLYISLSLRCASFYGNKNRIPRVIKLEADQNKKCKHRPHMNNKDCNKALSLLPIILLVLISSVWGSHFYSSLL